MNDNYFIYILTDRGNSILYIGITANLYRRMHEHKKAGTFTQRYRVNKLVYFEQRHDALDALLREKQLRGWIRDRQIQLVEANNPAWAELDLLADKG